MCCYGVRVRAAAQREDGSLLAARRLGLARRPRRVGTPHPSLGRRSTPCPRKPGRPVAPRAGARGGAVSRPAGLSRAEGYVPEVASIAAQPAARGGPLAGGEIDGPRLWCRLDDNAARSLPRPAGPTRRRARRLPRPPGGAPIPPLPRWTRPQRSDPRCATPRLRHRSENAGGATTGESLSRHPPRR